MSPYDYARWFILIMMAGYLVGGVHVIARRNRAHNSSFWEKAWVWSAMAFVVSSGTEIWLHLGQEFTHRVLVYPLILGFGLVALWQSARRDKE